MNSERTNWLIQWTNDSFKSLYNFQNPEWKYCKKKKCYYSAEIDEIWYKAPYKYNLRFSGNSLNKLKVKLSLIHKNKESISLNMNDIAIQIGNNVTIPEGVYSEEDRFMYIGPFHFNVCSYKHDGRSFRLCISLSEGNTEICQMLSPDFVIKAKKPIIKPGSKKNRKSKKRKMQQSFEQPLLNSLAYYPDSKKRKVKDITPSIIPTFIPTFGELESFKYFQFTSPMNEFYNGFKDHIPSPMGLLTTPQKLSQVQPSPVMEEFETQFQNLVQEPAVDQTYQISTPPQFQRSFFIGENGLGSSWNNNDNNNNSYYV